MGYYEEMLTSGDMTGTDNYSQFIIQRSWFQTRVLLLGLPRIVSYLKD